MKMREHLFNLHDHMGMLDVLSRHAEFVSTSYLRIIELTIQQVLINSWKKTDLYKRNTLHTDQDLCHFSSLTFEDRDYIKWYTTLNLHTI